MIVLLSAIGFYVMVKPKLVNQIKIVIFWYLLILVLNLINILGVLTFYEKNKMRKGPKGYKGLVGGRGLEGSSIMCQSCGLSGLSKPQYASTKGIEHANVKAGKCIFPFIADYSYQNEPMEPDFNNLDEKTINDSALAKFNLDVATKAFGIKDDIKDDIKGWCATEVDDQFNPTTIGFVDTNIENQIDMDAKLAELKSTYQNMMGVTDIIIISALSLRDAKDKFNEVYKKSGYTFIDQDMNEGTGGNFIYLCIKRGSGDVITGIEISTSKKPPNYKSVKGFEDKGDDKGLVKPEGDIDINRGSRGTAGPLYIYYIHKSKDTSPNTFYTDIKIQKKPDDIKDIPFGFEALKNAQGTNQDLNEGSDSGAGSDKILFLVSTNKNYISIDTAFVYKDGSLYMFVGNKFYKFSSKLSGSKLKALDNYPKTIAEKWGRTPSLKTDGGFGSIEVDDCSKYDGDEDADKCKSTLNCMFDTVNKTCEPKSVYDAAFTDLKGVTYFFKGSFVYKYNDKSMKIASGFPKRISLVFDGIPYNIDAVFVWGKDRATYFIKGKLYYKFNNKTNKVDRGYPKNVNERWPEMKDIGLINAIFTLPYYVKGASGESSSPGSNHTYIISGNNVYYIDPSSDVVSLIGTVGDVFENIKELLVPVPTTTS